MPISVTINKVNEILRGWTNYYRIGNMKGFMADTGAWIRQRIRVIMVKQWKKPKTIMKNLRWYCNAFNFNFSDEDLFKVANSRKGLYAQCNGDVINYVLSPKVLGTKITVGKEWSFVYGLRTGLAKGELFTWEEYDNWRYTYPECSTLFSGKNDEDSELTRGIVQALIQVLREKESPAADDAPEI